jgi:large subunit ribosomal protein L18
MASANIKQTSRLKRKQRIRKKLTGTSERPRLSVFRSANHIYAQIIDDTKGHTIISASSLDEPVKSFKSTEPGPNKTAVAVFVGKLVAQRAIEKGIRQVKFDRNGFLYHGRIKAVSQGAREAGLDF